MNHRHTGKIFTWSGARPRCDEQMSSPGWAVGLLLPMPRIGEETVMASLPRPQTAPSLCNRSSTITTSRGNPEAVPAHVRAAQGGARPSPARAWGRSNSQGILTGSLYRIGSAGLRGRSEGGVGNSWAAEAARSRQKLVAPDATMSTVRHDLALGTLQRDRATLLSTAATPADLLVRADESVPPTRIPEHWHIRVALPERPEHLDGYGAHRFAWAPDAEAAAARRLAGSEADGSSGTGAGTLTIFPMAEPQGALDVQLLEQWLREILAACGEPACVARDDAGACVARDEQERPATTQVHAPPGGR